MDFFRVQVNFSAHSNILGSVIVPWLQIRVLNCNSHSSPLYIHSPQSRTRYQTKLSLSLASCDLHGNHIILTSISIDQISFCTFNSRALSSESTAGVDLLAT
ncbi:hypothetical protein Hanom_Chr13g01208821 [Helianthus anomalus]